MMFLDFKLIFLYSIVSLAIISSAATENDAQTESKLRSKLSNYEIIFSERIHRKLRKRGTEYVSPSKYNRFEELNFRAFNQDYRVYLTSNQDLFHPNFKVYQLNDDENTRKEHFINPEDFFEGHVFGAKNSRVSLHFDENAAITGAIYTDDDAIFMEPAWRHIPDSPKNGTLVYRSSDFDKKFQGKSTVKAPVCAGYHLPDVNHTSFIKYNNLRERKKRQAIPDVKMNRCPVKLVADYLFFEKIGGGEVALASRYLINVIDRVNAIYTTTIWQDSESDPTSLTDQGLLIKEVEIHTKPTPIVNHYNMKLNANEKWNVERLLESFTKEKGSNKFCLVHLFTYQAFDGGVLGLGYIASDKIGTAGGICSAAGRKKDGGLIFYNTALSSARSTYGDTVITREADIVTAHEFGHNWGSAHDPLTSECSPGSSEGGSYIMHTYSVSGFDDNNKEFSPCSKRSIKAVLASKSDLCFTENIGNFCGNNRVEAGEECDPGVLEDSSEDPCCTKQCKLRPGMECSPKNSACCTVKCQFKSAKEKCLPENLEDCKKASYCNGTSGVCPSPDYVEDLKPCRNDGECQSGECVTFCEKKSIGMKPCICEQLEESCTRCCRNKSPQSECIPYPPGKSKRLPAGTPCIVGKCDAEGVCQRGTQDIIQHLWKIIDSLDINTFRKFLQNNLVGVILILSLIVWIPASLIVHHFDKKREKERREMLDWLIGESLVADMNKIEVVKDIKSINYSPNYPPM